MKSLVVLFFMLVVVLLMVMAIVVVVVAAFAVAGSKTLLALVENVPYSINGEDHETS